MSIKWPYILVLVLFFIFFCYTFYPKIENFFVFFPQSAFDLTPQDLRMVYKDVYFNTDDDQRLHGWFFPTAKTNPVILFFHGNAGNISHRLDNIKRLLEKDLQVFIFDYRGYGKSTGRPTEKGLNLDGLAAYGYLVEKEKIPPRKIILFGRSLGAAVAINIACQKPIGSIIIESAFTSVRDMAKTILLFRLFSWIMPLSYNNLEKIAAVKAPVCIIHGDSDDVVPFHMGQRLFEAAKEPKYFLRLAGAGHNDTYIVGGEEYFRIFAQFARGNAISSSL